MFYDFCSGNVDWTWREQADLVKWTRVSVTLSLELLSNLTMREIERDRDRETVYMKSMYFYKLNILLFFNLVPNSSIFTETTAT